MGTHTHTHTPGKKYPTAGGTWWLHDDWSSELLVGEKFIEMNKKRTKTDIQLFRHKIINGCIPSSCASYVLLLLWFSACVYCEKSPLRVNAMKTSEYFPSHNFVSQEQLTVQFVTCMPEDELCIHSSIGDCRASCKHYTFLHILSHMLANTCLFVSWTGSAQFVSASQQSKAMIKIFRQADSHDSMWSFSICLFLWETSFMVHVWLIVIKSLQ